MSSGRRFSCPTLHRLSSRISSISVMKSRGLRCARQFIGSLPNELPPGELIWIVQNDLTFISVLTLVVYLRKRGKRILVLLLIKKFNSLVHSDFIFYPAFTSSKYTFGNNRFFPEANETSDTPQYMPQSHPAWPAPYPDKRPVMWYKKS